MNSVKSLHGVMAEYHEADELIEAANKARAEGYTRMEGYTPFPVNGLSEALGQKSTRLQWIVLLAGIAGGVGGFFMQWYANVVSYPWNIGGRPFNSWPSWMPVTFELAVLSAAFAAVFVMFGLNGLPQPYHPVFNVKEFEGASKDKFFLCIESKDPKFELEKVKSFLKGSGSLGVYECDE